MSAADEFYYPTMARALIIGDKDTVARKTREGLDLAMDPKDLIFKGLIPGMDVVGKKFVAMMKEGAGFKVVNLGRDVAPEKFVAAVEEHGANIVGISALMTTTMPAMKRTIDALIKAGLRERVKVMVGGAPVSQAFADEIGADGYAKDSTAAVVKAKALVGTEVAP